MLKELRVAHLALVNDLVLGLEPGLTMLTGETGAGKSLIAGALGLLAGGKGDKRLIREGEDLAVVEGVFDLGERPADLQAFAAAGVRIGSDGILVLRRELKREGRGRVLINGLVSSLALFERLGPRLLSIQSQDQQRVLSRPSFACQFLDQALGLAKELEEMGIAVTRFKTLSQELADRTQEQAFADQQLEMWEFQWRELNEAALSIEEEAELREKLSFGRNLRSLLEGTAAGRLDLCDGEVNARQLLARSSAVLEPLAQHSQRLAEILALTRDAEALVVEAGHDLIRFADTLNIDPSRLDEMEARYHLYGQLQRKFSRDVAALLSLQESLALRIERQKNALSDIDDLKKELDSSRADMKKLALVLRSKRQAGAAGLARQAEELIRPLALPDLDLEFQLEPWADSGGEVALEGIQCKVSERGCDRVVLRVRTNRGESWNPVGEVASGGEKSRIFLGLSVLGGQEEHAPLQLFDEIDAGLGMDNAVPVAQLLRRLARQGQILCITHLPTVAALGHTHLQVSKSVTVGRTTVSVQGLEGGSRVDELARLLGGESGSGGKQEVQRAYAKQLLTEGSTL